MTGLQILGIIIGFIFIGSFITLIITFIVLIAWIKKNFPEYVTEKGACFSAGIECATDELNKGCIQTLTKENAELKARLFCTKETCDNCGFVKCENFQRQRKSEPCNVYISYKDRIIKLELQLTKAKDLIEKLAKSLFLAKGLIRDLIDDTVVFEESKARAMYCYEQEKLDIYKEAVQFLKEIDG